MDYQAANFWFQVLQTFGLVGLYIITFLVNRTKANRAAIDRVEDNLGEKIADHGRRLERLEVGNEGLPGTVRELELSVSELKGDLKAFGEKLNGLGELLDRWESTVERHEEHLLNKGGR